MTIVQFDLSLEFFPPKTSAALDSLMDVAARLAIIQPKYASVTYGAGGSTRDATHTCVQRLQQQALFPVAVHLTCLGTKREEVAEIADAYWQMGVRHIVALRGDRPKDASGDAIAASYPFASDLVVALKKQHDFEISVAAYPEKHPEAHSLAADIENLKRKQDAGATRAISQFFFDSDVFLRFRDMAVAQGITMPIIPGLLPVHDMQQLQRFAAMCGAQIPPWLPPLFTDTTRDIAPQLAAQILYHQCDRLSRAGCDHIHFYTLNRAETVMSVGLLKRSL